MLTVNWLIGRSKQLENLACKLLLISFILKRFAMHNAGHKVIALALNTLTAAVKVWNFLCTKWKNDVWAVVVSQLVARLLPITKIQGSNLVIVKFYLLSIVLNLYWNKQKLMKKRGREFSFFSKDEKTNRRNSKLDLIDKVVIVGFWWKAATTTKLFPLITFCRQLSNTKQFANA